MSVDAEDATSGPDLVLPPGLIVSELVSNALKHAFPEGRRGTVGITLRRLSEGVYQLAVRDNGVGIRRNRREGSLGLILIEALSEQVGGKASVETAEGTLVVVTFSINPPKAVS